jgi:hypothetical protein
MGDAKSSELVSDLRQIGLKPKVLFPETIPYGLKKSKDFNVLVTLQDVNSFKSPQHMKKETDEKIKFYGSVSNGILMFDNPCRGMFEDATLDFHTRHFFIERLSSENTKYGEKVSDCVPDTNNKKEHTPELIQKYRTCYNRLKDLILTPKAN